MVIWHPLLISLVRIPAVANTIAFLLIAIVVFGPHWADRESAGEKHFGYWVSVGLMRLAGGVFGFFQGAVLVVIGILVVVAFFPAGSLDRGGTLAAHVFRRCHVSAT